MKSLLFSQKIKKKTLGVVGANSTINLVISSGCYELKRREEIYILRWVPHEKHAYLSALSQLYYQSLATIDKEK